MVRRKETGRRGRGKWREKNVEDGRGGREQGRGRQGRQKEE